MGIVNVKSQPDYRKLYQESRSRVLQLESTLTQRNLEVSALEEQLQGPDGRKNMWWVQMKVFRQKAALRRLEARNASLRFAMAVTRRLRGEITAEEWTKAKAEIQNEQLQDRVSSYEEFMQQMPQ